MVFKTNVIKALYSINYFSFFIKKHMSLCTEHKLVPVPLISCLCFYFIPASSLLSRTFPPAFSHVSLGFLLFLFVPILDNLFVCLFSFILWRCLYQLSCLCPTYFNMDDTLRSLLLLIILVTSLTRLKYFTCVACIR